MSHVTTISVEIRDLAALESACRELGAEFVRGQTSYRWYGRRVNDTPLPVGLTAETLGQCQHAIKVPGINYEIGVVETSPGRYTVAYDFFGSGGYSGHDGERLRTKFGHGLGKLVQMYGVHKATREGAKVGLRAVRHVTTDGSIRLTLSK